MVRINIELPISSVRYNGNITINNEDYNFIILESVQEDEVHWLGLAPQNKHEYELKILEHLKRINENGKRK